LSIVVVVVVDFVGEWSLVIMSHEGHGAHDVVDDEESSDWDDVQGGQDSDAVDEGQTIVVHGGHVDDDDCVVQGGQVVPDVHTGHDVEPLTHVVGGGHVGHGVVVGIFVVIVVVVLDVDGEGEQDGDGGVGINVHNRFAGLRLNVTMSSSARRVEPNASSWYDAPKTPGSYIFKTELK
jgi:hypothetical protein